MPVLKNPKHERFAQELASGIDATNAYERAGYKRNAGNASTLKADQSISKRVAEILSEREQIHAQSTAKAIERVSLTKEWVIARLVENAERALQARQATNADGDPAGDFKYEGNVANRALELLGKELGMFIDRREVRNVDEFEGINDPGELRRRLIEQAKELGAWDTASALAGGEKETRGSRRTH